MTVCDECVEKGCAPRWVDTSIVVVGFPIVQSELCKRSSSDATQAFMQKLWRGLGT